MAVCGYSPILFVHADGSSMKFQIEACKSKNQIKPLIEFGGGIIQRDAGPNVIRLIEPGCKLVNISDDETILPVKYIYDCIKKNRTLGFHHYRIKPKVSDKNDIDKEEAYTQSYNVNHVTKTVSECKSNPLSVVSKPLSEVLKSVPENLSEPNSSPENPVTARKNIDDSDIVSQNPIGKSLAFNLADDKKMIEYVIKNNYFYRVREQGLYREMALKKITEHDSRAMQNQFINVILNNLEQYDLQPKHMKEFIKKKNAGVPCFKSVDDRKMIQFVIENNYFSRINDKELYKEMASKNVTMYSEETMRRRFTGTSLKYLREYGFLPVHVEKFKEYMIQKNAFMGCIDDNVSLTPAKCENKNSTFSLQQQEKENFEVKNRNDMNKADGTNLDLRGNGKSTMSDSESVKGYDGTNIDGDEIQSCLVKDRPEPVLECRSKPVSDTLKPMLEEISKSLSGNLSISKSDGSEHTPRKLLIFKKIEDDPQSNYNKSDDDKDILVFIKNNISMFNLMKDSSFSDSMAGEGMCEQPANAFGIYIYRINNYNENSILTTKDVDNTASQLHVSKLPKYSTDYKNNARNHNSNVRFNISNCESASKSAEMFEGNTNDCTKSPNTKFVYLVSKKAFQLHENEVPLSKRESYNCISSRLRDSTDEEMEDSTDEEMEEQLSSETSDESDVAEEQSIDSCDSEGSEYDSDEISKESFPEKETTAPLLSVNGSPESHIESVTHNQNTYETSDCSQKVSSGEENTLTSKPMARRYEDSSEDDFENSVIKKSRRNLKYDYKRGSLTFSDTTNNRTLHYHKSHVISVAHTQVTCDASECSQRLTSDKESGLILKSPLERCKKSSEEDFEPPVIKKSGDSLQCSLSFSNRTSNLSPDVQIADQNTGSVLSDELNLHHGNTFFHYDEGKSSLLTMNLSQEESSQYSNLWNKGTWNSHVNNSIVSDSQLMLENLNDHDVALPHENLHYSDLNQDDDDPIGSSSCQMVLREASKEGAPEHAPVC